MDSTSEHVRRRRCGIRIALATLAVTTALLPKAASAEADERVPQQRAGVLVPLLAGPSTGESTVVADRSPSIRSGGRAATITVTYSGFTSQAKAAFQAAVDIWKQKVSSPVPIKIEAHWTPLGPGVLGSAGPATFWYGTKGTQANTWYPVAIANRLAGSDLSPNDPDIVANFSSNFSNWYYGTSGPTPSNKYDLETVVLHEIGHGLGFVSGFSECSPNVIRWDICGNTYPTIYGRKVVNGANTALISYANGSSALRTASTNGNVFFNGTKAKEANGGNKPKLFAPNPWDAGSSISHLDENTYGRGNANSLMTPQLGMGERIVNPGNITMGAFQDIGWGAAPK